MRTITFTLLVLCSNFILNSAFAELSDYPYYKDHLTSIQKGIDQELKDALKSAIKNNKVFSYKEARRILFGELFLERDSRGFKIVDSYCEKTFDSSSGVGQNRIPNHNKVNCEHTWPQSRFNRRESTSAQKSDLHHLFPVKATANSTRGNIPFGEVYGETIPDCDASSRGDDIYEGTSAFEPPKYHKGNVARALFYFSVRYNIAIPDQEELHLRAWNIADPVDREEMARNERIEELQGNRNPFIDDPDLVDKITNL